VLSATYNAGDNSETVHTYKVVGGKLPLWVAKVKHFPAEYAVEFAYLLRPEDACFQS
jgi:hypothetical protein